MNKNMYKEILRNVHHIEYLASIPTDASGDRLKDFWLDVREALDLLRVYKAISFEMYIFLLDRIDDAVFRYRGLVSDNQMRRPRNPFLEEEEDDPEITVRDFLKLNVGCFPVCVRHCRSYNVIVSGTREEVMNNEEVKRLKVMTAVRDKDELFGGEYGIVIYIDIYANPEWP